MELFRPVLTPSIPRLSERIHKLEPLRIDTIVTPGIAPVATIKYSGYSRLGPASRTYTIRPTLVRVCPQGSGVSRPFGQSE
jgi:hypothetical protein